VTVTAAQQQRFQDQHLKILGSSTDWQSRGTLPPSLSTANISTSSGHDAPVPIEYMLKFQSLECLVETLRSLVNWSQQGIADATIGSQEPESRNSFDDSRQSVDTNQAPKLSVSSPRVSTAETPSAPSTPFLEDDPSQLERQSSAKLH
jgi:brefeldin A-inhibited guanine nucleotide-exchange protein